MELTTQELKAQLVDGTFPGMIPLLAAAELLGVTKAGLLKKMRSGIAELDMVTLELESTDTQLRGVTPESLAKALRADASRTSDAEALALARLRELAAAGDTEEYGPFMRRMGLTWKNPHHRNFIGQVLGNLSSRICEERCAAGATPIAVSVLVVLKATGMPNDSFFWFAEKQLHLFKSCNTPQEVAFETLKQAVFDSAGTW